MNKDNTTFTMPSYPEGFPFVVQDKDGDRYVEANDIHAWLGVGADFPVWWKNAKTKLGLKEGVDYEQRREGAFNKIIVTIPLYIAWLIIYCTPTGKPKVETITYLLDCEALLRELCQQKGA